MKKYIAVLGILISLVSCKTTQAPYITTNLYEVLTGDEMSGAPFRFYETITTEEEFNVLLKNPATKGFIKKDDILNNNFIIVNLGEKESEGFLIKIKSIKEQKDKIIVNIEEIEPKRKSNPPVLTRPYCVIKIKSKKEIEIL